MAVSLEDTECCGYEWGYWNLYAVPSDIVWRSVPIELAGAEGVSVGEGLLVVDESFQAECVCGAACR